ncbi:activator of 90 kDa heat shock protein ATPase homolog 2-like isoform X1 [Nyctibius grandis]|uniref:activator of 90 kDa heat shock protein ATPase homolog 2-like isoform X1 n=1 Tax=Nyctibius grandis TaxID=48427 RepID=UPI0035BBC157
MARWGQGDPRWIVEERADATNVNNWHWTERDATGWSKSKLKEVLVGLVVEGEAGRCEISDLKHVEGEASCNSRRGKLIFFYEWNLRLSWRGTVKESGEKHKGSVEIPNLSEENEVDDTEINVSKKKGEGDVLKDLMRTEGTTKVREALRDYLKALKTEFTLGMILPTKATVGQELAAERKPSGNTMQDSASPQSLDIVGVKIPTVKILMREIFNSPADELYSIFTTKEVSDTFSRQYNWRRMLLQLKSCLVQKFSKCPAVIEAEKGGKLQMFDGCVSGEYAELVPSQRIVLKWRCRSWPEEHYATVALNFKDVAAQTELQLECKGVPVSNEDSTRQCWKKQYFEEIHILLQQSKDNME